jgi:U4/U6 small nuclear ribonucleoprotein PRP31
MATLAESFLADLDELDEEELPDAGGAPDAAAAGAAEVVKALTAAVQPNNLDAAAPLVNSVRYRRIMQEVDAALARTHNDRARTGPLEDDPEYKVLGRM